MTIPAASSVTDRITPADAIELRRQLDAGMADADLLLAYGRLQAGRAVADELSPQWWRRRRVGASDMDQVMARRLAGRCEALMKASGIDPVQLALAAMITCCAGQYLDAFITVRAERAHASWGTVAASDFQTFCEAVLLGQGAVSIEIKHDYFADDEIYLGR
jgi:hypothetical protein